MNCALSVLLPFVYLAKRVSTKIRITEKGNSYTIKLIIQLSDYLINDIL